MSEERVARVDLDVDGMIATIVLNAPWRGNALDNAQKRGHTPKFTPIKLLNYSI